MSEISNNIRAALANSALADFINWGGDAGDEADNIVDLIADLLHLCDVHALDPEKIAERALFSYRLEAANQPKADATALDI